MSLHPAALDEAELLKSCRLSTTRRSGPGGQNRNKVETAVILEHLPTGIRAEANERRHQGENRAVAVTRLRLELALRHRTPVKPDGEPTALWRSRCSGGRISVNESHQDFPALLAEALDRLDAHGEDFPAAATALGVTTSQLVKLLKKEPHALAAINRRRRAAGHPPLR